MDNISAIRHSQSMHPLSAILFLLCASCFSANGQAENNRVILPASATEDLLAQCSRDAPLKVETTWQPTDGDIDTMEAALPEAVAASPEARNEDFSNLLTRWRRQYVGLVRGGRRYIYGNYFPADEVADVPQWRNMLFGVCDGGPQFFGAEFDVDAKRITRIDFNGSIG